MPQGEARFSWRWMQIPSVGQYKYALKFDKEARVRFCYISFYLHHNAIKSNTYPCIKSAMKVRMSRMICDQLPSTLLVEYGSHAQQDSILTILWKNVFHFMRLIEGKTDQVSPAGKAMAMSGTWSLWNDLRSRLCLSTRLIVIDTKEMTEMKFFFCLCRAMNSIWTATFI